MTHKNNPDQQLWDYHQTSNANKLIQGYPRQNLVFNLISHKIQPHSKVLEIGFGDGYLLSRLSSHYQCTGADISPKNIKQTKAKLPNVKFDLMDTSGKLPYQNNYFDAFIASEVLEHMDNTQLSKTITEIHRILKPNGTGIVTVPAEENLDDNICFCPKCGHTFHRWGHKQSFTRSKINKIFSRFNHINVAKTPNIQGHINFIEDLKYFIRKKLINFFPNIFTGSFLIIINK